MFDFLMVLIYLVGSIHLSLLLSSTKIKIGEIKYLRWMLFGFTLYAFGYFFYYLTNNPLIARTVTTGGAVIAYSCILFFISVDGLNIKKITKDIVSLFAGTQITTSLLVNIFPNPRIINNAFLADTSIYSYIFTLFLLSALITIIINHKKRKEIDYAADSLMFSFVVFALFAITLDSIVPLFIQNTGYVSLAAPISSAIFSLVFFYQITKASELEINQSATRFSSILFYNLAIGVIFSANTSIALIRYTSFPLLTAAFILVLATLKKEQRKHQNLQSDYRLTMSYLADIAHRLKTPLAVIDQQAEQAIQKRANTKKTLEEIRNIAHNTAVTMKNIVQINKIEYGFAHLDLATQDLALFFDQLKPELEALAAKHKFSLIYPNQVWLKFDRDRLREALLNIIDNAVKFGPKGSAINVTAVIKEDWIEISIQDEGPGIDPEIKKHLFERYYQSAEGRQHAGSSGLGLAITKWIVEEHGGKITVQSRLGRGTKFTITLPTIPKDLTTRPTSRVVKQIVKV